MREAMHPSFLFHARRAGLDMAIANAGRLAAHEDVPKDLLERVEDVLLARRLDATDRLIELVMGGRGTARGPATKDDAARRLPIPAPLAHAMVHGVADFAEPDVEEAPPAESSDARNVKRIRIEAITQGRRRNTPMARLTAEAHASGSHSHRPTTMWIDDGASTHGSPDAPSPTITLEIRQSAMFDKRHIHCLDEGPVFHLFRITEFRDSRMGRRWP